MRYRYLTCDVFTTRRFGGNQLAILPEAEGLDTAAMQRIAAEFNYSETTFVLPPADPANLACLRIFTPGAEMPFAGHPTVGTALALGWLGRTPPSGEFVLEEKAGSVPVKVARDAAGDLNAEFTAPEAASHGPAIAAGPVAQALGLEVGEIVAGGGLPCAASCGAWAASRACRTSPPKECSCSPETAGMDGRICAPACSRPPTGSRRTRPRAALRRRSPAFSPAARASRTAGTPGGSPKASRWAGRA
jgi:hypothetical protein